MKSGRECHGRAADGGGDDPAEGGDAAVGGVDGGVGDDRGRHRAAVSEGAAGHEAAEVADAGGGQTDEGDVEVPLRRRDRGNDAADGAVP